MLEVVFLGTGPAIAPPGRANLAFVVRCGGQALLCEAGPAVLPALQRAAIEPRGLGAVFISHRHGDHTLGFPMLVLERMVARSQQPLRAIVGHSLRPILSELVGLVYPEAADTLARVEWLTLDEENPDAVTLPEGWRLESWPVCGPPGVPVLGARITCPDGRVLAYTGDTAACDSIASLARDCDLLIHEANFSARLNPEIDAAFYGHSTASQAARAARQAGARALALVHLSALYAGREAEVAEEARAVFEGAVFVPSDGEVLRLP